MAGRGQTAWERTEEAGRDRECMGFRCFAEGNEIFLIFRSANSNLVTWMSPKARNEPGWRIAGGCVRPIQLRRNI
mgnify:CR=1 FL=1